MRGEHRPEKRAGLASGSRQPASASCDSALARGCVVALVRPSGSARSTRLLHAHSCEELRVVSIYFAYGNSRTPPPPPGTCIWRVHSCVCRYIVHGWNRYPDIGPVQVVASEEKLRFGRRTSSSIARRSPPPQTPSKGSARSTRPATHSSHRRRRRSPLGLLTSSCLGRTHSTKKKAPRDYGS